MQLWKSRSINAVDLGHHSIKIIQLTKKGQALQVSRQVSQPGPGLEALERGNVTELAASLGEAAVRAGIDGGRVISFIGGHHVIIRQIVTPQMPEDELQRAMVWEAEKLIPIPTAELEVRPVVLEKSPGDTGDYLQLNVLLAAVSRSLVYRFHEIFDRAGLTLTAVDLPALGLWRVFHREYGFPERKNIQAVVDIGSRTCQFIVIKQNVLSYVRTLGGGGGRSDSAPGEEFTAGLPDPGEGSGLPEVYQQAGAASEQSFPSGAGDYLELVTEIRRSLDFYRLRERQWQIEQLVITGGGSQLKGLADILALELGIPVKAGYPQWQGNSGEMQSLSPQFSMAFGLALREVWS